MKTFLKGLAMAGLAAVTAVSMGGCGQPKAVLHVYNWSDYVKPELVQRFEAENHCRVVIDTFDSNEAMYNKLKAGAGGYDVIFPSNYFATIMHQQGMLQPLQPALLPNLANLDRELLAMLPDNACAYSVPYMMSYTGLAVSKSRVKDFKPSWAMLARSDLKGRITLLDDMREVIGAALKTLGYSINTTDEKQLEDAKNLVLQWKKNAAKFDNEQYKNGIASGEFLLVMGYCGDVMQVMKENRDVAFAVPVEGTQVSCDLMVIPKDAKNGALAHAFINFLHDPKVAAENMEFVCYRCPNAKAYPLLSAELRANPSVFVPKEILDKSELLRDLGVDNAKYTKVWDQIKAAE